ncbi:chemotaxis protein CheW [Methylopila sp. M107]|uniref:hybrid sensor histidine kinase/response regulator n=1 Tax=Methylopila sp. M107 TaxID=1101190 RepID=UPI000366EBAE|nr:chemotaxis protein CheW [Methylopila sp. M107]
MDDLLRDFLTETGENLDLVDVELVRFEHEPENAKILGNIFRLVHTVKGACGFLGLPRLEALAHAAETLMGRFRSGAVATPEAVTLILSAIDRIKEIMAEIERTGAEPAGADVDLVAELERTAAAASAPPAPPAAKTPEQATEAALGRPLLPGEISLDELERIFQEAPGPDEADAPEPAAPVPAPALAAQPVAADAVQARAGAEEPRDQAVANQSIRVGVDTLDRLMTMVSELVLTRNQLTDTVRRTGDETFALPLQRLTHVTAELQEGVMKARMQPISAAWRAFPRLVRDLASDLGKKIELVMEGGEAELDRQVLDLIKDPLTHMVRNCADHGLETPAERAAKGKPDFGTIRLSACHQGGYVIVEISDDGRGLDPEKIRRKAVANGLAAQAEVERLTDAQAYRFIFSPGFSTADRITNVSGRGVGLDVVRANVELIGGSIDLKSAHGVGTTFVIRIPLTLAIIPALTVVVGGSAYAIPQLAVLELARAGDRGEHRIERVGDTRLLRLRDELLPLVGLKGLLGGETEDVDFGDDALVVIVQSSDEAFGIVVDEVLHTEEIVVKPMASRLKHIALFAGTTILGDGSVVLILDPNGLAQSVSAAGRDARVVAAAEQGDGRPLASTSIVPMLLFRAGAGAPKAAPLALLTRLEMIDSSRIEHADGRLVVQYRGALMPLIKASDDLELSQTGEQPLLVFSDDGRWVGLIVDEILDIVEERIEIGLGSSSVGTQGAAVISGRATEILDVGHYLTLAFDDWLSRKDRMVERTSTTTILLVDDSAFFRNMLTPALTAAGYLVTPVDGGAAALALVRAGERFDIIISDLEMPGMDGFALAKALRGEPAAATLPILALSSLTAPEVVDRAHQSGFSDYVAKFDRPRLVAALKTLGASVQRRAA